MSEFSDNYINLFFGLIRDNIILTSLTVALMGFTTLLIHSFYYRYLLARNFIFVSFMLPTMVLLVTKVIATNLYLSLGMIGALSIVRYRTPVKSQYELTFYFALICLGIIIGVNVGYAFLAYIFLILSPSIYSFINFMITKLKLNEIPSSDSEGCFINILIKKTDMNNFINKYDVRRKIKRIDTNEENKESSIELILDDMGEALLLEKKLNNDENIKSINISRI